MKKVLLAGLITASTFVSADDIVIGTKVGTLGIGLETTLKYNENLDFRVAGNAFSYSKTDIEDNIKYDIDLNLATVGVIADYHPFSNAFIVSGGVFYNGNSGDLDATPVGVVNIGGTDYVLNGTDKLHSDLDFNTISPYIGIGYSNVTRYKKGWFFTADAGVLFQGKPTVTLEHTGVVPISQSDLDKEAKTLQDDLNALEYYPVLSIGVSYKF